jgi:DNA modification methylase
MTVAWHTGDALDLIRGLPDGSVDAVICSPPFLALRNYNHLPGQWGTEADPASFVDRLLTLAVEARRVLAPHGSLVVELGDTYAGSGRAGGDYYPGGLREGQVAFGGSDEARREGAEHWRSKNPTQQARPDGNGPDGKGKVYRGGQRMADHVGPGWPLPKSLCLIPGLFAASLAYGRNLLNPDHGFESWRVRNLVCWARPNPPPGALGDKVRPATSYLTVACPSDKRWFDLDAVRIPGSGYHRPSLTGRGSRRDDAQPLGQRKNHAEHTTHPGGVPPLDHWWDQPDGDLVWLVSTHGSDLAHYAMWPPALAERLVLSMCPPQVCRTCGQPRRRLVEADQVPQDRSTTGIRQNLAENDNGRGLKAPGCPATTRAVTTVGWSDCGHDTWRPGVVLDPFCGAGTTLAVADLHGRDAIGFDLDPANQGLYQARYQQCWQALKPQAGPSPVTPQGRQLALQVTP